MNRKRFLLAFPAVWVVLAGAPCPGARAAPASGLLPREAREAILEEISGERALDSVYAITRFDRVQASPGWHAAAEFLRDRLQEYGYSDARIEGWPSDGTRRYLTWSAPPGWRARRAELRVLEPVRKRIADFGELPTTLVKHSRTARVEAELIDVGEGTREEDYRGRDPKGRIVLATGYTGDVHREAVLGRGALGVVTYLPEFRDGVPTDPDLVPYTALWPKKGERDRVGFGFTVSRRTAWELLGWLREGKRVVLGAEVEAELFDSEIEVLTTTWKGSRYPNQEVWLLAHLDHYKPGANDNASGSAGLLEMARALRVLVDSGKLSPPLRTIRFLWVSEFFGTAAFLAHHPEVSHQVRAAINCDMIGEDLGEVGTVLNLYRTPDSNPSFLNDLVENLLGTLDSLKVASPRGSHHPFHYRVRSFRGGSDHVFLNEATFRIPAVMLGHWPDRFHHTIQDSPDKVDPAELRRVSYVALGSAYYVASARDAEAVVLAQETAGRGAARLYSALSAGFRLLDDARTDPDRLHRAWLEARNLLRHAFWREETAVASVLPLARLEESRSFIHQLQMNQRNEEKMLQESLEGYYRLLCDRLSIEPRPVRRTEQEERAGKRIPKREAFFRGPLSADFLEEKLGKKAVRDLPLQGDTAYEVVNFLDGRRSLLDVRDAVSAEFDILDVEEVETYLRALQRAGLVRIVEENPGSPGS